MRSVPARLWALSFLSALLQLLPFPIADPVPVWRRLFCWFCLVPLLFALKSNDREDKPLSIAAGASLGYACGATWFAGNCYWVYQTMNRYGGLPPLVSLAILVLFSLYLGLYFGLFGACFAALRKRFGSRTVILLSPLLWVAVELARARITGFPWDLLGYTQVDNSLLVPLAPWTGVMGLSLVVALANALWLWRPACAAKKLASAGPAISLTLVALGLAGSLRAPRPEHADRAATLLQENLSVGEEGRGRQESEADLVRSFSSLSQHPQPTSQLALPEQANAHGGLPQPQIIVWPEAPTSFSDADPNLRESLGALARLQHAPLVVDAVGVGTKPNRQGRYDEFASASFYLPDGTYAGRYDKMHLVPFGEYTPYKQLFFFAGHLLDDLVFVPGTQRRLFSVGGHRFGVFICYESIFGDEVREFARTGAQVLVNLSDDGWYGDTSAPWEHVDMARMRAIENRRWLLRATNTGLTAAIDPNGRVVSSMPRHIRGAIEVPFAYRNDLTFYTLHGDWIAWLCAVVVVAFLVGGPLQQRYPAKPLTNK